MTSSFFAVPYQVFFEDTMAYGTHHYLTNFRFQCVGRETLLFDILPEAHPESRAQLDDLVLLTREGYTRNLAPVRLGEKVGILMSQEDRSRSSIRLCFRVVREDGQPVCCGYQTIVFVDKTSYEPAPFPDALGAFITSHEELKEQFAEPSFAERCHVGGKHVREMFTEAVCALGKQVATTREPKILGAAAGRTTSGAKPAPAPTQPTPLPAMSLAFLFPGQGSYDRNLLRELFAAHPEKRHYFGHADRIARDAWGHGFMPLVEAASDEEHDAHLRRCPELDQLGIFLGAVMVAEVLIERGARPDVLVGHSFGEVGALCVGGAFDVTTGLEMVIARVNALRDAGYGEGAMLAVSAGPARVQELLDTIGVSAVDIAGINSANQSILSGPTNDIKRLVETLPAHGAMGTLLKSRHPFHSSMLRHAVSRFESALRERRYGKLKTPVFSPIVRGLYPTDLDVASVLSSHFIRPFDFQATVNALHGAGVRTFVECGAGETLSRIVRRNLPEAPATIAQPSVPPNTKLREGLDAIGAALGFATATASPATESTTGPVPVAIVSVGCVLPGARDPDELWRNVGTGVSGIAELTVLDPMMATDFQSPGDVVPDKAYSLLAGIVRTIEQDPRLPYSEDEFRLLTRAQRLFANALVQSMHGMATPLVSGANSKRVHCLLGSTADGIKEYDEALAMRIARDTLASLDEAPPLKAALAGVLEEIGEMEVGDADAFAPYPSYLSVIQRVLGPHASLTLLDAACAASLYALDVAMKMLAAGETDLVIAGGVFSPGPGINVLFGQFKGLSGTGCFPFDARADGVIFGEGAAVLALKRLPDAFASGDHIHAVIRGVGLASDGKSASVNVPRSDGQVLAMRRAYEKTGIDPNTIQYLEAHATSTTVGDATEFESLRTAFGDRRHDLKPIWVESVKALTGHTGWVAGATSVIKVARALGERRVPAQHNFVSAHPAFRLSESPFVIPTQACEWTANIDSVPRRAGINGFGFGGTNAHLILEEFDDAYHRRLAEQSAPSQNATHPLVVVGVGTLFPAPDGTTAPQPNSERHFDRRSLRLPGKKRLLPDVTEHMDGGQYLAAMAADLSLANVKGWESFRNRIGIALGATAKTAHGAAATSRVYVDRLKRALGKQRAESELADADFARLTREIVEALTRGAQPSNPYTLIGFMPNVAAGRVSNLFDLQGANVVLDAGGSSLEAAIATARRMLIAGDCELVLAGAVQCTKTAQRLGDDGLPPDGVCLVAITTPEVATARGLSVLSRLELAADTHELRVSPADGVGARPAEVHRVEVGPRQPPTLVPGLVELSRALNDATTTGTPAIVRFETSMLGDALQRAPARASRRGTASKRRNSLLARVSSAVDVETIEAALAAAAEPVAFFTPALFSSDLPRSAPRPPRRTLFLVDQTKLFGGLRASGLLTMAGCAIAAPSSLGPRPDMLSVDLSSDETIRASLESLDCSRFDAIVAIKDLGETAGDALLDPSTTDDSLLDLLFAVARHAYPNIQRGDTTLATICLNGLVGTQVQPFTGLAAGFMKSMARELPAATCKSIITNANDPAVAMGQLANEIGASPSGPTEVCYDGGSRQVFRLVPVPDVTVDRRPYIDSRSVVVATGGGRGVTALMAEELLQRFGCTVVLLGRTDPSSMPAHVLEMDAERFKSYEPQYYKEAAARDPRVKPAVMRRQYQSFAAGREIAGVVRRLSALPGRVEYRSADVTNAADVERVIAEISAKFGRVDLVMHGAGVQTSTRLDNRKLDDFRRTIDTKLGGLRNLYAACRRHVDNDVHFHVLTSAFSYIGNDGQPDYGAANEAMNRLAQLMNASGVGSHWTSLAWLAWDGIGMTRGSEYAVLVTERGLHGITADEGRSLFATLMAGRPTAAANILLTNAERRLLKVDVADDLSVSRPVAAAIDGPAWRLDLSSAPYLREHVVNGTPTLPGTFELALAVEAACSVRPRLTFAAAENMVLSRFVKVADGHPVHLRSVAQILSETGSATTVHVALVSDFVHKSGAVLQKDVVHFEVDIHLATAAAPLRGPLARWEPFAGRAALDPYMDPLAPVRLQGTFACLHDVVIGDERRRARFRINDTHLLGSLREFRIPPVLLDAMLRLTVVEADGAGTAPVFVPERIERIRVAPSLREQEIHESGRDVLIVAAAPAVDKEMLNARWVQALDADGRTLALVEFGVARRVEGQALRDVTARPSFTRRASGVMRALT